MWPGGWCARVTWFVESLIVIGLKEESLPSCSTVCCSYCQWYWSLQVSARGQVTESQWKSGQPQQQKLTCRSRQANVYFREQDSNHHKQTGLHKGNRDSKQQKQPTVSTGTLQISLILQMSPSNACICFPYLYKTEASQDKFEWNVNLHFNFFVSFS